MLSLCHQEPQWLQWQKQQQQARAAMAEAERKTVLLLPLMREISGKAGVMMMRTTGTRHGTREWKWMQRRDERLVQE